MKTFTEYINESKTKPMTKIEMQKQMKREIEEFKSELKKINIPGYSIEKEYENEYEYACVFVNKRNNKVIQVRFNKFEYNSNPNDKTKGGFIEWDSYKNFLKDNVNQESSGVSFDYPFMASNIKELMTK